MAWYRSRTFIAGMGLIVLINAVVLAGVLYNRGGTPDSTLVLSERELRVPYRSWHDGDNSGMSLNLAWRVAGAPPRNKPGMWFGGEGDWLDRAKLDQLGVEVRMPAAGSSRTYSESLSVDVLLVLELNGPAYRQSVEESCPSPVEQLPDGDRRHACDFAMHQSSRLFVVDGGLDRDALRRKYPDTSTYAIVHGQVRVSYVSRGDITPRVVGYVTGLAIENIDVPASARPAIPASPAGRAYGEKAAPLEARVAFGRRLEPWLVSVAKP